MNTEQQLRERAEAILAKHILLKHPGLSESEAKKLVENNRPSAAIDAMIDFHKQELQRIGEVYQAVSVKDELPPVNEVVDCGKPGDWRAVTFFEKEGMRQIFHDYDITHWLKKLSLLEVKDLTDK